MIPTKPLVIDIELLNRIYEELDSYTAAVLAYYDEFVDKDIYDIEDVVDSLDDILKNRIKHEQQNSKFKASQEF